MIVVDVHEVRCGITRYLKKLGADFQVSKLDAGDYLIEQKFIAERKTVVDLSNSIISGRIFVQLKKILDRDELPLLIIEGDYRDALKYTNITPNSLLGFVAAAQLDLNVRVFHSPNTFYTALLLKLLDQRKSSKILVARKKIKVSDDPRVNILCCFPGIGLKTASKLLNHFHSLENIFTASVEQLEKVIGSSKARKIKLLLSDQQPNHQKDKDLLDFLD